MFKGEDNIKILYKYEMEGDPKKDKTFPKVCIEVLLYVTVKFRTWLDLQKIGRL